MIRPLALAAILATPLNAHEAATGWPYDPACCSDRDCHHVRTDNVRIVQGGYQVEMAVGDHPYTERAVSAFIPADSSRVRISGDSDFHVCANRVGNIYCIYIPLMGV